MKNGKRKKLLISAKISSSRELKKYQVANPVFV